MSFRKKKGKFEEVDSEFEMEDESVSKDDEDMESECEEEKKNSGKTKSANGLQTVSKGKDTKSRSGKRKPPTDNNDGLTEALPKKRPKEENHVPAQKRLTKKHFSGAITVGITGARQGDILHGCAADTTNVVLRVDQGTIPDPDKIRSSVEEQVGRDTVIKKMAKQFGISVSAATMKYNDCPVADGIPNHQPLGQGCSHNGTANCRCEPSAYYTILNQGIWQSFAEEHGNGNHLKELVQQGKSICYRDILKLVQTPGQPGGKTLILRPKLFQIVQGPVALADDDPRLRDESMEFIDASSWVTNHTYKKEKTTTGTNVYEMDGRLFRLPESASSAPSKEDLCSLVKQSLEGLPGADSIPTALIQTCVDAIKLLTVGGLKSLLQKTIRFHSKRVDMSIVGGDTMPAGLVAAVAAGHIFTEAGNFTPELQLYTRGCTSALKRMAVILVEDAWVLEGESAVLGLMALALATQRMAEYHPPTSVVIATMRLAVEATMSPYLIAWRKTNASIPQGTKQGPVTVDENGIRALKQAADLLTVVKSFPGDIDMMDTVAGLAKRGTLMLTKTKKSNRLQTMPLCHCVDQHTYRGIGHIGPSPAPTFANRFQLIFGAVTGFNPRQANSDGFERRPVVKETRFAQQCVARFAFHMRRSSIADLGNTVSYRLQLDSGTLAAAAGPIPVRVKIGRSKKEVLVMLGVRCPEDEIVMLKPARATRDLFGSLTNEERASAIAEARKRRLPARSPVLKAAREISFENGCWRVDGEPWVDHLADGCSVTAPLVETPVWARDSEGIASALTSDEALEEALTSWAKSGGVVDNAAALVEELTSGATDAVALRAISMLRQQYVSVTLPTPALDGGLASDQLVAYKGDWDVFRLLALVARLVPGALRPAMPPNFMVVNANLLRLVERWMIRGLRAKDNAAANTRNAWVGHQLWAGMTGVEQRLMEHQRCAVASMRRRDQDADSGHFLIMDTGVGKTVTSLSYLYKWLTDYGRNVTMLIWITPKGTVENLCKQLKCTWSAPVWCVPRLSKAKCPSSGQGKRLVLKDYRINVIHADHLRDMIDVGLAELAPRAVCVFDEVDEMYAPTLRTSAARRLAQLCAKFVAQTATPMRRNENQLMAWLSDTCSFPVDNKNLLVAASGMVSIQLELGIASKEALELIPMTDSVRSQLRDLLVHRQWLLMARMVQEHSDSAMVKLAVELSAKDRKTYRDGGVLLVADTNEHAEKLIAMCNSTGRVKAGGFETFESSNAGSYGIVVVPKDKDRGYNSAVRLGMMVTGVYPGNGASRHQMRGRLRRLGQQRKMVTFHTLVMENSLLHLLHIRHDAVDSMNISLQELGDKFSADVLQGLKET